MALHPHLERDVALGPGDAEDHVAVGDLAVVEGDLAALVHLARDQLGGAGDAAAVFAAIRQIHPLLAQRLKQRAARIDVDGRAAAIGQGHSMRRHSHMSLVQSPPG